jgi:hypothetical protein
MMRKVVDTNILQCDALKAYLSASTDNYAVLTEYVAQESYKKDTLASIYACMQVLLQFPKQVIVLKGAQDVCRLTGRDAASQTPLIDEDQTRGFPEYCQQLLAAQCSDLYFQRQLLKHGLAAAANIDKMLLDMPTLSCGIDLMAKIYSPGELKILRRREPQTPQMLEKRCQIICLFADELFFKANPGVTEPPRGPQLRNTFIFRYAICGYVAILKRIRDGRAAKITHERLRNDNIIDVNIATFATYFDGLLTTDKRAGEIYAEADLLLQEVFAMPPAWLAWLLQRRSFQWCLSFFVKS